MGQERPGAFRDVVTLGQQWRERPGEVGVVWGELAAPQPVFL